MPTPLSGRNIALVTRIYGPEPGAASYRLAALARAMRDAGAAVRVLTTRPPRAYPGEPAGHEGIEIRRAPVLRDRKDYVRGYLQYASFDVPAFFRVLFSRGLDGVVVEPPPTSGVAMRLACGIRRIPYVYYLADIWSDAVEAIDEPGLVARLLRRFELFALNGAATVISASQEFTDRVIELGVRSRIVTLGNGADDTLFTPEGPRRDLGHPYLVYAGTASEMHGADIFIDAVARVRTTDPDVQVVFVGQGSDRDLLEEAAARIAPGAVHFEPRLSPEETAEWIRGAVATLASVRPGTAYHRMFPVKMYASVVCGTRVVYAGTVPGRTFADEPGNGWGVDYDVDQVAEAMRDALAHPATEAERAKLARRGAAEYSLRAVAERGVEAIAAVLPARRIREGAARR
ncbi:MAG TPA: glycosyltransferase family 4 protein [Pseudolysinimonas sp.]|nr:glycosyltransferase family 4 protein [Pseudolysinimonas sp.]